MLSYKCLSLLIDTYGADPLRWPEVHRSRAEELLRISEPARAHLEAARSLDASIRDAVRMADSQLWAPGDQAAALARVRSLVGSVISVQNHKLKGAAYRPLFLSAGCLAALTLRTRAIGLAFGCSLAIAVGFFVGSDYVAVSTPHNVVAIFQPALLQVVTD
jgi:hypothetical protein